MQYKVLQINKKLTFVYLVFFRLFYLKTNSHAVHTLKT